MIEFICISGFLFLIFLYAFVETGGLDSWINPDEKTDEQWREENLTRDEFIAKWREEQKNRDP